MTLWKNLWKDLWKDLCDDFGYDLGYDISQETGQPRQSRTTPVNPAKPSAPPKNMRKSSKQVIYRYREMSDISRNE
jgi:hypothetical protein